MQGKAIINEGNGTPEFGIYVNGEWRASSTGKTLENRNPARPDDLIGHFASASADDTRQAIEAAQEARYGWARTSPIERANILYRASEILASRAEEVGRELTREEGKTVAEGIGETKRAVAILRYYAGELQQPDGEHYPSANPNTLLFTMREPIGVVGIITPWNFPIAIPAWKIAPAIAFGNTVVFKPASLTPLCAVRLVEALDEAGLPKGVVNLVTGGGSDVGDVIVNDERVEAISFTGSNAVGNQIKKDATERGAKVQLEMGGKNPAIVMADADLDHAVTEVIKGAMMSTGQKCTATSRAIVDRKLLGDVTERIMQRASAMKVGDPSQDGVNMGPLIDAKAAERVLGDIEKAKNGASLAQGGGRPSDLPDGHFVEPTVFTDVDPNSYLGQEELFGPVLGVIPVDGLDEAVAVANQVRYGLSASIFTRDIGKALSFIREVQAGIVHVNSETAGAEPQVPFGGYKGSSSYSREQGKAAREFFTQVKTVYFDPPPVQ
ncbi:MAG TPA: aldehyde dehydrogenase family protein [Thermomicrobiales bacterium]|nr:aldehyde dehydrogenase family protein [Thermomicrobiales bacterium]